MTSVIRERILRGLTEVVEAVNHDFTLPGLVVIELKNNGTTEPNSLHNLDNYLEVRLSLDVLLIRFKFIIYLLHQVVFLLDIGRWSEKPMHALKAGF